MRRTLLMLLAIQLAGCATPEKSRVNEAVQDFIIVSELEEQEKIRTRGNFRYDALSEQYLILKTNRRKFLVEFGGPCKALNKRVVAPDFRRERNYLRSRFDTIRGCAIRGIYAIDEGQAQELEQLGMAPGEGS